MKRAWTLVPTWGTPEWHRTRVAERVLGAEGDEMEAITYQL